MDAVEVSGRRGDEATRVWTAMLVRERAAVPDPAPPAEPQTQQHANNALVAGVAADPERVQLSVLALPHPAGAALVGRRRRGVVHGGARAAHRRRSRARRQLLAHGGRSLQRGGVGGLAPQPLFVALDQPEGQQALMGPHRLAAASCLPNQLRRRAARRPCGRQRRGRQRSGGSSLGGGIRSKLGQVGGGATRLEVGGSSSLLPLLGGLGPLCGGKQIWSR